jgi:DNA polymerase-3 subunit epsilon
MARLLGLDLESTGLDTATDHITEIGYVLWDTDTKTPLKIHSDFLYAKAYEEKFTPETCAMMKRLCGITPEILREFGSPTDSAFKRLATFCELTKPDYIVAHNGENFDKPMLFAALSRNGLAVPEFRAIPWIDTKTDIPFDAEPDSRRLKHLALDQGFINPFEHRAVFDVLTMLKVLSAYDLNAVIAYQKIPFVTMRALVSYDDRQLAKDQRFSWEKIGEKTYPKMWVKKIKENQIELETQKCKFQIARIE